MPSALLEALALTGTVHAQSVAVLQRQNTHDRWGETSLEQEIIYPDPKGQKAQQAWPASCWTSSMQLLILNPHETENLLHS